MYNLPLLSDEKSSGSRWGCDVTMKILAVGLTLVLALCLVVPQPAYAQIGSLTSAFNLVNNLAKQVLSFIKNTMKPLLEGIQTAAQGIQGFMTSLRRLWEEVVWPMREIARARALALQLIAMFRGPLNGLYSVNVNSATLPRSIGLENVIRNHHTSDHPALVNNFQKAFGPLPAPADVHPEERNLLDMDDAMAIDQLMLLKQSDATADRTIEAAEKIENEATVHAPGTAAMVSATASIAAVQSQAHMQKMIAGQLRLEAARLAHDTMSLKRAAGFTKESRQKTTELNY